MPAKNPGFVGPSDFSPEHSRLLNGPVTISGPHPPVLFRLPFRGSRNYLHSTDIFPALTRLAHADFSAEAFVESLTLRHPAGHQIQVQFHRTEEALGTFRLRHGTQQVCGWLVETDQPVDQRVPYDESAAVKNAIFGPGFARFPKSIAGHTAFEQLLMLMRIVSVQVGPHHWWFSQIDLSFPFVETDPLEFRIRQTVSNRFLTGHIHQGGRVIGLAVSLARPSQPLNDKIRSTQ